MPFHFLAHSHEMQRQSWFSALQGWHRNHREENTLGDALGVGSHGGCISGPMQGSPAQCRLAPPCTTSKSPTDPRPNRNHTCSIWSISPNANPHLHEIHTVGTFSYRCFFRTAVQTEKTGFWVPFRTWPGVMHVSVVSGWAP